jgi:hypothetical protein
VVAVLLVLALVVVHRILRSHLGRAFEALRGSPVASDCMGVSVYRYKVYAFVISAGFAGWRARLYAYSEQYISPNTYNFELTVLFLLAVIMGGRKSRIGAMLGATIIVLLPKLLDDVEMFRYVSVALAVLVLAAAVVAVKRQRATRRADGHSGGGQHRAGGPGLRGWRRHDRLAAVDLRRDHAVRRLLPAGRHRRLRAQGAEHARPTAPARLTQRTWPPRRATRWRRRPRGRQPGTCSRPPAC